MIENVKCPKCGGEMASRTNRGTGQKFWGCKKYPACKGTLNTDGEVSTRQNSQRRERPAPDDDGLPSDRMRSADRRRWDR